MKLRKAPGPDDMSTEMYMLLSTEGKILLLKLLQEVYDTGEPPEDWNRSVFMPQPKTPNANQCKDHRTISLICHGLKILLKIILKRVRNKIEPAISQNQFGFVRDSGTRNAVFVVKNLIERSLEVQRNLYLCFIDYKKAFDMVKHDEIMHILDDLEIDDKDLRLIQNIYYHQRAIVNVGSKTSEEVPIERGVRQGCVLSPGLFNLYSECITRSIDEADGLSVGGQNINNIRYADDMILIADTPEKLQNLVNTIVEVSKKYCMELNTKKTKVMTIARQNEAGIPPLRITVGHEILEEVKKFKYLGTTLHWDGRDEVEVNIRVAIAKKAFNQMKTILTNKNISIATRRKILTCYIMPIVSYNSETWTITKKIALKLQAFEMWCLRKMQRIPWTAKKRNSEVLHICKCKRSLLHGIRTRQLNFLGHILRKQQLENLSLTGKIVGRKTRGRQRATYMTQFDGRANDIIQRAQDRRSWRVYTAVAANAWNRLGN